MGEPLQEPARAWGGQKPLNGVVASTLLRQ
jgi:hypothetical protein